MSLSTGAKVGIGVAIAGALGGIAAAIAGSGGKSSKPRGLGHPSPRRAPRGKLVGGCGCGR